MNIKIEEEVGGRESLPFSPVAGADRSFLTDSEDLSGLVAPKEESNKEVSQLSSPQPASSHPDLDNFPSFPSSRARASPEVDLNVAQGWLEDLDNLDIGPSQPADVPVRDSARGQDRALVSDRLGEDLAMEAFFNAPEVNEEESYGDTESNVDSSMDSNRLSIVKGGVEVERESLGYKVPRVDIRTQPPDRPEVPPRPSDRGPKGFDPAFPPSSESMRNVASLRDFRQTSDFYTEPRGGTKTLVPPLSLPQGKTSLQGQQYGEGSFKPTVPGRSEEVKAVRASELKSAFGAETRPSEVEGRGSKPFPAVKSPKDPIEPSDQDFPPSFKQSSVSASLQALKKDPPQPSVELKLRPLEIATEEEGSQRPLPRLAESQPPEPAFKPALRPAVPVPCPKPQPSPAARQFATAVGTREEPKTLSSARPSALTVVESPVVPPVPTVGKEEPKASARQTAGYLGNLVEEAVKPQLPTLEIQESDSLLTGNSKPAEEEKKTVPPLPPAFAMGKSLQGKEQPRVKFDPASMERGEDKLPPLQIGSITEDEEESGDYDPIPVIVREPVSKPQIPGLQLLGKQGQQEAQPGPRVVVRDMRLQNAGEEGKRLEEGRPQIDAVAGRLSEPPVLTYHQCYDRILNSDLTPYRTEPAAPPRSCLKAMLACCSSTHEILVPEVKTAMSVLLAFEKRPMDISKPIDQSILMSIWGRCMGSAAFALQHEAWKGVIGFAGPQPLAQDTVGTLGMMQFLFCLSEGKREVVQRSLEESRKPGKGFALASASLDITRLALKVVKSGVLNQDFERHHNVRDVFNCFALGCFVSWVNQNAAAPGRVDLATFEKSVRRDPVELILLGKKSIALTS